MARKRSGGAGTKLPKMIAGIVCLIVGGHIPDKILEEITVEQIDKKVEEIITIKAIITTCKRCDALVIVKKLKETTP